MGVASAWIMSRIGYVETARAVMLAGGEELIPDLNRDWRQISVVEVSQDVARSALDLCGKHELRSLDAIHLASALVLPENSFTFASWDRQLHRAAQEEGIPLLPKSIA